MIQKILADLEEPPEQAIARLVQAGRAARPGETLLKAGEPSGHTPIQLIQIVLLGPLAQGP